MLHRLHHRLQPECRRSSNRNMDEWMQFFICEARESKVVLHSKLTLRRLCVKAGSNILLGLYKTNLIASDRDA